MTLGERLRELRGTKPRAEVAEAIGVELTSISNYENDIRIPRDEIKMKLSNYYGIPIGELFYPTEGHKM